ncbi:rhomboid family intramembrane serine protease [Clostridium sp. A1-XYC3]|uniref:Rhomboid family intramembrane serine protease n=1 Tax=Clostridium tanneri TaxID=3037988 RepID=A0ABU4JVQ8_9CLOT|nr:rhomboid family intramembrane serine protease [Clostridium sp. A1-XYC3]MDW8802237.1 rhomboid family intramembrane serine protease [Clostridium sp. A1-XYC3]
MDVYIRKLIQELFNRYGYRIVEFGEIAGLSSSWGVVKSTGDGTQLFFFSDLESNDSLDINKVVQYAAYNFQLKNIRPIQILVDKKLHLEIGTDGEGYLNHKIYPQCELILINNVDNKILYYSKELENEVHEVANSMGIMESERNEISKTEKSIITYLLIGVNLLVYAMTAYLSGSIMDSDINVLIFLGAKVNELISSGEYYRLLTCMFLHGGIAHIGFNMYALSSLGPLVESVYGKIKYIFIYFLAGIVSSIFSYMFSTDISVGASGAIFGLLGAALVFGVKMKNAVGKNFMFNIASVIVVNLILGFSMPNIDNFGHLGGLIGGIAVSYFFMKSV